MVRLRVDRNRRPLSIVSAVEATTSLLLLYADLRCPDPLDRRREDRLGCVQERESP